MAFSGGVDSTLVLKLAHEELGDSCLAVTERGVTCPSDELEEAKKLARKFGVEHAVVTNDALKDSSFCANTPDRCYFCKLGIFGTIKDLARERKLSAVLDGSNLDDPGDHRPGLRACKELGVRSPLTEAGLRKAEIRAISHALGLPTWDKPARACLASRIPYGSTITEEKLAMVDRAELLLMSMGFRQCRVRHHETVARIEVPKEEIAQLLEPETNERIVKALKELGFTYVAADLQGFRSGSLNEVL